MIWKILGNFVDPITYEKIAVLGGSFIDEMTKVIDIDQIPKKYKGKGVKPIKIGFCADLPHDRYPLDYYEKKKQQNNDSNNKNDDQKQE